MLTVFSKNFPKSKIIKTYKTSRQHETPVDSTQRPLQYIQEPTMDEEDREEDRRNNIKSNSFDGESLSTHDSIHFFHSKGILICNEEGKVLCDGRSEIGHVRSQDLDEQGQNEEEGKEKQTRYPDKYDDIDLSFHMEDSLLDSSDLYRVLDGVDEGEGLGNCRGTYDSQRLTNEDKVHFEAAFVNLGQVMFKNQPNRIASNSKCSSPVEGDVQKKLFDSWNRNILSRASTMALFLFGAACTYTFISILAPMKDRTTIPISENFTEQQDFAKEVFLQAMYMLSTFPQCSEEDVVLVPSQNFMSSFLPYTITLLMVPVFRRICNSKGENTSMKDEMCSPLIKKSPGSCKMEGSSLSRRKRLQREMASLDKGNIVSSTFITEIVTPTGELSSVKRSSRIGGRKMKDTIRSSSVNLTGVFHLEDGDSPSKTQVTLVSNK